MHTSKRQKTETATPFAKKYKRELEKKRKKNTKQTTKAICLPEEKFQGLDLKEIDCLATRTETDINTKLAVVPKTTSFLSIEFKSPLKAKNKLVGHYLIEINSYFEQSKLEQQNPTTGSLCITHTGYIPSKLCINPTLILSWSNSMQELSKTVLAKLPKGYPENFLNLFKEDETRPIQAWTSVMQNLCDPKTRRFYPWFYGNLNITAARDIVQDLKNNIHDRPCIVFFDSEDNQLKFVHSRPSEKSTVREWKSRIIKRHDTNKWILNDYKKIVVANTIVELVNHQATIRQDKLTPLTNSPLQYLENTLLDVGCTWD